MIKSKEKNRIAYQEFGDKSNSQAFERSIPELPPNQQNLRVQTSRSGRAGKTVTMVTEIPITIAGSSLAVTAKAEHIPNT